MTDEKPIPPPGKMLHAGSLGGNAHLVGNRFAMTSFEPVPVYTPDEVAEMDAKLLPVPPSVDD